MLQALRRIPISCQPTALLPPVTLYNQSLLIHPLTATTRIPRHQRLLSTTAPCYKFSKDDLGPDDDVILITPKDGQETVVKYSQVLEKLQVSLYPVLNLL